ncbi:MAG: hypothetical protein ACUVTY_12155 [Armatimonadota bacterium]
MHLLCHRVDQRLEPACVVACPTTARIFGDVEDPNSKISRYIAEQQQTTGRAPFKLLPEAQTQPANMYLGTMAAQDVSATELPPSEARYQQRYNESASAQGC